MKPYIPEGWLSQQSNVMRDYPEVLHQQARRFSSRYVFTNNGDGTGLVCHVYSPFIDGFTSLLGSAKPSDGGPDFVYSNKFGIGDDSNDSRQTAAVLLKLITRRPDTVRKHIDWLLADVLAKMDKTGAVYEFYGSDIVNVIAEQERNMEAKI